MRKEVIMPKIGLDMEEGNGKRKQVILFQKAKSFWRSRQTKQ